MAEEEPEITSFMEDPTEYFRSPERRDELHLLLTDQDAWESFVDEANLPREEAEVLLERLRALDEELFTEDINRLQSDPQEREHFLNEFPGLKQKLEEQICKLRELVDRGDKVHRNCTIANIVASSAGVASSVLTVLSLGLAPVTAGTSLALSVTGIGLGAASVVTSAFSSMVEKTKMSSLKAEASQVTSAGSDKGKEVAKAMGKNIPQAISITSKCIQVFQNIRMNARAMRLAKANPRLVAQAKRFMTAGRVSVRSGKQVQKAFGGTALAMTRGARFMGAATAGISLMMDVANILEESKHFREGSKAESAEELRQHIKLLESKLKQLIQTHERLKKT